jgi:mono/diheme cytochrome c family protein
MRVGLVAVVLALWVAGPALAEVRGDPRRGQELYVEKCVLCHGGRGEGWDWAKKVARPPVPVPDLARVTPKRSDQFLFDIIRDGGEAVGQTRFMPAFGFQLSEQDVWDLVAYLRSLGRRDQR